MPTNRNLALVGAGVLIIGLFCPVYVMKLSTVLSVSFVTGAKISAPALLGLALIGGAVAVSARTRDTLWAGIAAATLLLYHFVTLQFRLPQIRAQVAELADTPFRVDPNLAPSAVQIQWGWLVLAAGAGLMIYAGARSRRETNVPTFGAQDAPGKSVLSAATVLAIGAIGWSLFA